MFSVFGTNVLIEGVMRSVDGVVDVGSDFGLGATGESLL